MTTIRRLPLVSDVVLPPGVDQMRERLGGRPGAIRFAEAGSIVAVKLPDGTRAGVVLTADESGGYVWLAEHEVRRVPRALLAEPLDPVDESLRARSDAARAYGALEEGSEIEFAAPDGAWTPGRLLEKCRFGALVARADGKVLGVGFRSVRALPH